MEILEAKNIISEISNSIDGLNSILDTAEERISKLEERSVENNYIESQAEKKKDEKCKSQRDVWDTTKGAKYMNLMSQKERRKREGQRQHLKKKRFSFKNERTNVSL